MRRQTIAIGMGTPVGTARALAGADDKDIGATATGATSQANSYGLKASLTTFTTTGANTGARIMADMEPGDTIDLLNLGASTLFLYPPVGGNINGAGANAKVDVATLKNARITCFAPLVYGALIA